MEKYLILHGSFSSKDGNWFPWLKEKLEQNKKMVYVPQMPIGVGKQNFENWSKELDKIEVNENTIIIAHSIAPIFVCKYLLKKQQTVKKLIFVCGFNNYLGIDSDYDAVNEPMYIESIKELPNYCDDIICYYSDNDPYVPYQIEKDFADQITKTQYLIKNGGHLNSESGYQEFPDILSSLEISKE